MTYNENMRKKLISLLGKFSLQCSLKVERNDILANINVFTKERSRVYDQIFVVKLFRQKQKKIKWIL